MWLVFVNVMYYYTSVILEDLMNAFISTNDPDSEKIGNYANDSSKVKLKRIISASSRQNLWAPSQSNGLTNNSFPSCPP